MVFIAIDKHSRKILGYLCRNSQNITYCCSECEVEFTRAKDLEAHMVLHESPIKNHSPEAAETIDEDDIEVLSNIEKERQLQIKYQVSPCTVQLHRFEEFETNVPTVFDESNINQENCSPPKENQQKKRPASTIRQSSSIVKKQKFTGQKSEKVLKKKSPPKPCFLCGKLFNSSFSLEQHQKTHLESSISIPVFPCNVCGKSVKNMKMHLRLHKNEQKTNVQKAHKGVNPVKSVEISLTHKLDDTKVEEASSSTDAVHTKTLKDKEPENVVSSNDEFLFEGKSNESQTISQNIPTPSSGSHLSAELLTCEDSLPYYEQPPQYYSDPLQLMNGQPETSSGEIFAKKTKVETIEPAEGGETFKCIVCTKKCLSEVRLIKHLALHENKVRCEICGKLVGGSYQKVHMKKYHTDTTDIIVPSEIQ